MMSFPDDSIMQKHAENLVEALRQVTWRHLIDMSIVVLDAIARAANDAETVTKIADKYVFCECILGFSGEHCDICPILGTFMI